MSVSDSCLPNATMAVPGLPLSTRLICAALSPVAILEPSSAGNVGGSPLPVDWWQAAQLAAYTFAPLAWRSARVHCLLGSSARALAFFFCSATHCVYFSCDTTLTTIGMKPWFLPQSSAHWPR